MRQILHIFRKDVRYLRLEIAVVIGLAATYTLGALSRPDTEEFNAPALTLERLSAILLVIASAYLISRVIHADAVAGQNQFWITRPYRWKSLLAAKLLFILAMVNLPVLAARLVVLIVMGFPVMSILTGLLWSQLLLLICIVGPIAAVAALTADVRPFVLTILGLLVLVPALHDDLINWGGAWPKTVEWFRDSLLVVALAGAVSAILYTQYKARRTAFGRTLAIAAIALGAAAYWSLPLSLGFAVQARLSAEPSRGEPVRATLELSRSRRFDKLPNGILLDIPVTLTGIPANLNAHLDAFSVNLEGSGGHIWESGWIGVNGLADLGKIVFLHQALVDLPFFESERARPVTLRGSIYLTLIGNPQETTFASSNRYEYHDIAGGLQCGVFPFQFWRDAPIAGLMSCRAPFGWPRQSLKVAGEPTRRPLSESISYSPFPVDGMGISPEGETIYSEAGSLDYDVKIVSEKPVAHFRRDFEISGVQLDSFVK